MLRATVSDTKVDESEKRRKQTRFPFRYPVKIIPFTNGALGQPMQVWTRDISASGIGIVHNVPIKPESKFIIRLTQDSKPAVLLLCTVRNCRQVIQNVYAIGATFTEVAEHARPTDTGKADTPGGPKHGSGGTDAAHPKPASPELTSEVRRLSEAILR